MNHLSEVSGTSMTPAHGSAFFWSRQFGIDTSDHKANSSMGPWRWGLCTPQSPRHPGQMRAPDQMNPGGLSPPDPTKVDPRPPEPLGQKGPRAQKRPRAPKVPSGPKHMYILYWFYIGFIFYIVLYWRSAAYSCIKSLCLCLKTI